MTARPEALALDIGGTKLAAGLVNGSGQVRERRLIATDRADGAERVFERALGLVADILALERAADRIPVALAISTNGITREGGVDLAPAVEGWSELRIPAALRERFPGLRTIVMNDVKAATRAEMVWGELRGVSDGLYVNLGTGFAAGIVAGGRLLEGAHGAAGEVAYIAPTHEALANHRSGEAALEERIGGRGVEAWTKAELGQAVTASQLLALPQGDARAHAARERLVGEIALWVANLAIVVDPARVVLGGGMVRAGAELCRRSEETLNRIAPFRIEVVPARFGSESALLGAGAVALSA